MRNSTVIFHKRKAEAVSEVGTSNMEKKAAKLHKGAKDTHGNPEGTSYNEQGIADHEQYSELTNLKEGVMYNEDGSVFTPDPEADKKTSGLKHRILELNTTISKGKERLAHAQAMHDEADEADKPVYAKSLGSQAAAIASNEAAKAELEKELEAFRLSQITPAQRRDAKELAELKIKLAEIQARIKDLEARAKIGTVELPKGKADAGVVPTTEEQKANHAAAVAEFGSQGKAIVAYVKQGWTNTEIYKHLGIPAASVPGPKNNFLDTAEGQKYEVVEGRARLKA